MGLNFRPDDCPPRIFIRDLASSLYLAFTYWENQCRISGRSMIGRIVPFAEPIESPSLVTYRKVCFESDLKEGLHILYPGMSKMAVILICDPEILLRVPCL